LDDPGLFLISGTLTPGHTPEQGEKEIYQILNKIMNDLLPEREVQKAKNKVLTELAFSNYDMESRASNLCFYEWLGILDEINKEEELYDSVTREQIRDAAAECFRENQSSVLYYLKQNE
jgi:predicted Zn-dependent peptidase